jgi:LacI family transcriptional regulator
MVLCASKPPSREKSWSSVGSLTLDNRTAMDKLVQHLAENDYRKMVHLAGPPDILDGQERSKAFLDGVAKHRGVTGTILQGAWTAELARSVVSEYLRNRRQLPDVFVAFNDAVALGTIEALKSLRIAVPEEIAVTGWDDIPFSAFTGLSTVHLPMVEMGWEAARMLFRKLDGKTRAEDSENLTLEMPLQIRQTT